MDTVKTDKKIFIGNWMILATWLIYLLATTPNYATGIISANVITANGWSEGISGISSSAYFLGTAVTALPGSVLIKRKGARFVAAVGTLVGIMSYIVVLLLGSNQWVYVVTFFGMGVYAMFAGVLLAPIVVNNWFDRNKASRMAIMMTSGSVGGFLMPLIVQPLVVKSVSACWILFIAFSVACLVILTFFKESPDAVGEVKDGIKWVQKHPENKEISDKGNLKLNGPALKTCYRSGPFAKLSVQLFVARAMNAGIISYIVIYAAHNNITMMASAILITIYNGFNFAGRLLPGFADRLNINKRWMNTINLSLLSAGMIILFHSKTVTSFYLACAVCGIGYGIQITLYPLMVSDVFGNNNFVIMNGTLNTIGMIGGFLSPMLVFAIEELSGSYAYSYLSLGMALLVCAVLACMTPVNILKEKVKSN